MTNSLDMGWRNEGLGKRLSNFWNYPFVMDGIQCGGIEGFIQSLKFSDPAEQASVAALAGYKAYEIGQFGNGWKDTQTLHWAGKEYPRASRKYRDLIVKAYDCCFDQNVDFQLAVLETGMDLLTHYIGRHDQTQTLLTETEYVFNIYRLRARAQQTHWLMNNED